MTTLPLPLRGNEERWNGQRAIPVDPAGSRQPPLFSQPPIGYRPAQAGNPPRPTAPVFFQNQFTDAYGLPQNHLPQAGIRFLPNEPRYRVPPTFPPSTNSTEGLRFVHGISEVNDDGRHRPSMPPPPPPLRRPHWEDDPYATSSFRESDIASDRGAYLGPHGHCCQSGPHHYHRHSVCGGVSTPFCNDGHCPSHYPGLLTYSGNLHHCTYRNGCYSPCADPGIRRNNTLTYIGPPACGGNVHCSHGLPSCGHVAPILASQATTEVTTPDGRTPREGRSSKMTKGWGDVGRWLGKRFSAAKRVIPKTLKPSNTRRTEDESRSQEPPQSQTDATLGAESNSEAIPPATTTSRTGDISNSTSSESTGPINPSSSDDTNPSSLPRVNTTQELIPRPISSASTCQCNPSTVTLHRVLQHKPFDNFELLWNVTLPPKEFVFWGSTPEEILTGRPAHFPDDALFLENATDPPIRHMFINGLGDFPLERCQGDPDPTRSKDKERHMYSSGISDEKVELRTLPWPIRITGTSTPDGYITLWDILRTIYLNFQQYMRKEEYELYIIERKRLIASAYHQRKRVLDGKRNYRPIYGHIPETEIMENYIEDGYMRCDYLGSSLIFRGLEVSPDGIGYTLFIGPN